MALLIRSTGHEATVRPTSGKYFSLEELQRYVGGYIEIVALPGGKSLIVNEEGKLQNLPPNEQATILGRFAGTANDDIVVGDVLVCGDDELES